MSQEEINVDLFDEVKRLQEENEQLKSEIIDKDEVIAEHHKISQGDVVQILNEEQFFEVVGCCDTHVDVGNWYSDIDDIPVGKILCVWKRVGRII